MESVSTWHLAACKQPRIRRIVLESLFVIDLTDKLVSQLQTLAALHSAH